MILVRTNSQKTIARVLANAYPHHASLDDLIKELYDDNETLDPENVVKQQITRMRKQLDGLFLIVNVPGKGYRLEQGNATLKEH